VSADLMWIIERYLKLNTSRLEPSVTAVKAHVTTTWFPCGLEILSFWPGWRWADAPRAGWDGGRRHGVRIRKVSQAEHDVVSQETSGDKAGNRV
jgi:hypothetical protein